MDNLLNLIFLGAPGSGKGTQAKLFAYKKGYIQISTGDLLRQEVAKKSILGEKIGEVIRTGNLVNDEIVYEVLRKYCDLNNNIYIFDGFPRNLNQVKFLNSQILCSFKYKVFYFNIHERILLSRLSSRRICMCCGSIYNLIEFKPKILDKCDKCNSNLEHRLDDTHDVILERLKIYNNTITPLVEFYRTEGCLHEINANASTEEIYREICNLIFN